MKQSVLSFAAALATYGTLETVEHLFGGAVAIVVGIVCLAGAGWILLRK